ncbi:octopamine receptor isoform X1 [Hydra vulgaris]|uniref:octopamine receptor isoform X1 n=1 Tax=Hydra vulgaris TaxID=6087 RepID=UPI001F5EB5CF|nr:octopamine receptor-like [Hydra vulgaris]
MNAKDWCKNVSSKNYTICDKEYLLGHNVNEDKVITIVIGLLIMVTCIFGNLVLCLLLYKYRRLRTVPNCFIASLSMSDLMVGFFAIPLWISVELTTMHHISNTSTWLQVVDIFCCVSSIINLTAVSVERYFGVRKPLKHRTFMSAKVTNCFIASIWIYSGFLTLFQLIPGFQNYLIFIFIMGFMLPCIVLSGSYSGIFFAVRYRKRRRRSSCTVSEISITKSLFIVTSVFIACWVPFFVYALLFRYCTLAFVDTTHFIRFEKFTKLLHYSNSALNPIIYGACNLNFRICFKDLFKCLFKQQEDVKSNTDEMTQDLRSSFFRQSTAERQSLHREHFDCNGGYSSNIQKESPLVNKTRRISNVPLLDDITEESCVIQQEKQKIENTPQNNENDVETYKTETNIRLQEFSNRLKKSQESKL